MMVAMDHFAARPPRPTSPGPAPWPMRIRNRSHPLHCLFEAAPHQPPRGGQARGGIWRRGCWSGGGGGVGVENGWLRRFLPSRYCTQKPPRGLQYRSMRNTQYTIHTTSTTAITNLNSALRLPRSLLLAPRRHSPPALRAADGALVLE
jgi:hypothetical protein